MKIKNLKIKIAIALTLVVAGVVGFKALPTSQKTNYVAEIQRQILKKIILQ